MIPFKDQKLIHQSVRETKRLEKSARVCGSGMCPEAKAPPLSSSAALG